MKKLLLILALVAMAFGDIKLGTGSQTGNYYKMSKDIKTYCQSSVSEDIQVLPSEGSLDNLQGLSNKKYSMGIVQSDALLMMAKTNPSTVNLNLIKIVEGLHTETLHLMVPINYQPTTTGGSVWDKYVVGQKPKPVNLSSLKGQTVSSWGGSLVSAKALSYFFGLNWKLNTITEAQAPDINTPILLVGGQPYPAVEKLLATGKFRLLPIDYNAIASVAPMYQKVSASYRVDGKQQTVPTIGIQALLIGKAFKNEERNKSAIALSQCLKKNIADLSDDSSTSPVWQSAYENSKKNQLINWTYFN
jgi:hypothetical protein